ncbi:metallophosphoesterase family protein [Lachnospira pectinoschiza]|uniref:metallophosphoesterase family protein n=1 Tax=Lachnospira pectinoschiza TaxID=28052 RepID=UPI001D087CD1|nr:metallophosphoesterase family protein [Lachnospira pectinoschiza]MCB6143626.1 metallophosphoesterase family protein [Lachnospira pectinoschiza]
MLKTTDYKAKKILILSDIHGNYSALNSVLKNVDWDCIKGMILLGDLIDYGPSSNETIELLKKIENKQTYCNIWGNHEYAIMTDTYDKFSSQRGILSAKYTKSRITDSSIQYLEKMNREGKAQFMLGNRKCLAVHGSLENPLWKSIYPDKIGNEYSEYDYVFSGHSHREHFFSVYYEADNAEYRNEKRTIFVNPGSVGQPRNHNPAACYAVLNLENDEIEFKKVNYDIQAEQDKFSDEVDQFYKKRLECGI